MFDRRRWGLPTPMAPFLDFILHFGTAVGDVVHLSQV